MSANVLFNLLNKLGKRYKMQGLPSILSLFRNEFRKFNNTRKQLLETLRLLCHKNFTKTLQKYYVRKVVMNVLTFPENL